MEKPPSPMVPIVDGFEKGERKNAQMFFIFEILLSFVVIANFLAFFAPGASGISKAVVALTGACLAAEPVSEICTGR